MRALVAIALAVAVFLAAGVPHVHAHPPAGDECAVCTLRHAPPPGDQVPDVVPLVHAAAEPAGAPLLAPRWGAPLGSVPGQSPPARA